MWKTQILGSDEKSINYAAELIKKGEVVGIPTETVYGLGANGLNEDAVRKIFQAKGRPGDNPLIVHISQMESIDIIAKNIPDIAIECAKKFWPGPLTIILPKKENVPLITSGGLDTVGIRMPSHKLARKIISASGFPIAAPSANISGSPSPTMAEHVLKDMNGKIPAIVDGGRCDVGVESTVICFEGNNCIRILRPGFISREQLMEITENVIIDRGITENLEENVTAKSPGMKYKHYAPKAEIVILDGSEDNFYKYVDKKSRDDSALMVFSGEKFLDIGFKIVEYGKTSDEQAKNLFKCLRQLDEIGAKKVYAMSPEKEGVGLAVYNRLLRAAAFREIKI